MDNTSYYKQKNYRKEKFRNYLLNTQPVTITVAKCYTASVWQTGSKFQIMSLSHHPTTKVKVKIKFAQRHKS